MYLLIFLKASLVRASKDRGVTYAEPLRKRVANAHAVGESLTDTQVVRHELVDANPSGNRLLHIFRRRHKLAVANEKKLRLVRALLGREAYGLTTGTAAETHQIASWFRQ